MVKKAKVKMVENPKVIMTNEVLTRFYMGLKNLANFTGVKFIWAVEKNELKLEREVKALEKGIKMTEDYEEYEKARIELCKEHAVKDNNKKPITIDNELNLREGKTYLMKDQIVFENELKKLRESKEHKEACKAREEQLKQWNKLLEEEQEHEIHFVDYEELPKTITKSQLSAIIEMIRDPKEE